MAQKFEVRYSPKTQPLFSGLGEMTQHAVNPETQKSYCGRDASDWWKMDEADAQQVNCTRCKKKMEA